MATISLNRAQKRAIAKPWRVRKYLKNLAKGVSDSRPIPVTKRKRPRRHNGIEEAQDVGPETGTAG